MKRRLGIGLIFFLVITVVFGWARHSQKAAVLGPVIQIHDGAIRGLMQNDVIVYRGIPFAAPPVGNLRWRAPAPVEPWSGVLNATLFKPACMQVGSPIPGLPPEPISEDCL